ncbi:MAG: mechanosensitive ion channel family protein [Candidatus Muiribacteriota bacterium]
MFDIIIQFLDKFKIYPEFTKYAASAFYILGIILISIIIRLILKHIIIKNIHKIFEKTKNKWDDYLISEKTIIKASNLIPAFIYYTLIPQAFPYNPELSTFFQNVFFAYILAIAAKFISSIANVGEKIYNSTPVSRTRPIKVYIQVFKVFLYSIAILTIIAILLNKPVLGLLSGIGAMSAILMLVFKDSILGLAASFQLSANNMVNIGDWIEMPKYGADGDVIEITLQTIKVKNWDNTITTIPIYAMVSDSFKNWRGMSESGGRRIKRAINIDMTSIKFATPEAIEKFSKMHYLKDYITAKKEEIDKYNKDNNIDTSSSVNGRRITNIGTFRAYIKNYLAANPHIHKNLISMVRQLPPTEQGLPIEIYCFTNDTAWVNYEAIQADIFDHLLSVIEEFDLRVYQLPSGADIRLLRFQ